MAAPEASIREKPRNYEGRIAERNLPMPDSARLTTQLLDRTISDFREVLEVRLADMDKAILMAVKQMKKIPLDVAAKSDQQRADIDRQIFALREFIMSQIENIRDVARILAYRATVRSTRNYIYHGHQMLNDLSVGPIPPSDSYAINLIKRRVERRTMIQAAQRELSAIPDVAGLPTSQGMTVGQAFDRAAALAGSTEDDDRLQAVMVLELAE